ncbi:lysoplasmalogenase [candidate division KSB1 bacterium]|nr:lysoplasmalogenase [candidate division KSB1 bacterium]
MIVLLTLLTIVTASLHIHAEYQGPRYHVYLFKPLTMVFILLIAIQVGQNDGSLYKYAIVVGLVCSLAGDVFLMLPSDRFIAGLISFFIVHILYITAFTSGIGLSYSWWLLPPFVICGIFMFFILSPYLGKLTLPVLVYVVVILVMAWQAWERWNYIGQSKALLASFGAVLFLISDSALALNRFRGQYISARALTLSTYFAAQWLIALSVGQQPLQ